MSHVNLSNSRHVHLAPVVNAVDVVLCLQIDRHIPISMPALSILRHLALTTMEAEVFPLCLTATKSLTHLNFACNDVDHLPGVMTRLTSLVLLDLSWNEKLELCKEAVDILEALPAFKGLQVDGCSKVLVGLPDRSIATMEKWHIAFEAMLSAEKQASDLNIL